MNMTFFSFLQVHVTGIGSSDNGLPVIFSLHICDEMHELEAQNIQNSKTCGCPKKGVLQVSPWYSKLLSVFSKAHMQKDGIKNLQDLPLYNIWNIMCT